MTSDQAAVHSIPRRQVLLAACVLIVWFGAVALLTIGAIQSAETGAPKGGQLAVGVVIVIVGAIASSAIAIAVLRCLRTLPSPPESSRAERLQVIEDIKHGRVSENVQLEQAYAARMATGTQRVTTLVGGIVMIAGVVVLLPGTPQTIALVLSVLVLGVLLAASVPQTRRARLMLTRLPPSDGPDPMYQAKVQRQFKRLWRWTGLVFLIIAVVVLVIVLAGGMPVGVALGVWIGLALMWVFGYFHSSWMARPR